MDSQQARQRQVVTLTQVLDLLEDRLPDIAEEVFTQVWGIPGYDDEHLPSSDLTGYVKPNLAAIVHSLRTGSAPVPDASKAAREIGEARALQGVPIDAVIQSWSTAERVLRDRLLGAGSGLAVADLHDCIRRLAALFVVLTRESIDGYRRTQDEVTAHYDRLTTDLLARLTGEQPADPDEIRRRARSIGVEPSTTYAAIAIAVQSQQGAPEAGTYLRIQRHLLGTVGARVSGRVLVGTIDEFPLLLVPKSDSADGLDTQVRYALDRLPGPESAIIGISADVADLPSSGSVCQQAREALEVGRRLHRDGPVIRFGDVAADVLLLRNPDIARLLAARLAPLRHRPELIETLRTYLSTGLSARETARRMFVHANTVPYRLKLIEQALGCSLASAAEPGLALGLRTLALAGER